MFVANGDDGKFEEVRDSTFELQPIHEDVHSRSGTVVPGNTLCASSICFRKLAAIQIVAAGDNGEISGQYDDAVSGSGEAPSQSSIRYETKERGEGVIAAT